MSDTKMVGANEVQKGGFILMGGIACKVVDLEISKPGKHGHTKVRISAIGLVDGKKRIEVMPGHDNVEIPIVEKRNAQVLSVQGEMANVMDAENYETFDIKIPEEFKGQAGRAEERPQGPGQLTADESVEEDPQPQDARPGLRAAPLFGGEHGHALHELADIRGSAEEVERIS